VVFAGAKEYRNYKDWTPLIIKKSLTTGWQADSDSSRIGEVWQTVLKKCKHRKRLHRHAHLILTSYKQKWVFSAASGFWVSDEARKVSARIAQASFSNFRALLLLILYINHF
jgi:hypothetical protein